MRFGSRDIYLIHPTIAAMVMMAGKPANVGRHRERQHLPQRAAVPASGTTIATAARRPLRLPRPEGPSRPIGVGLHLLQQFREDEVIAPACAGTLLSNFDVKF
nr:hypothetical protein [uncultured Roseococcus sp.]